MRMGNTGHLEFSMFYFIFSIIPIRTCHAPVTAGSYSSLFCQQKIKEYIMSVILMFNNISMFIGCINLL